jgi:hypothetical protein
MPFVVDKENVSVAETTVPVEVQKEAEVRDERLVQAYKLKIFVYLLIIMIKMRYA